MIKSICIFNQKHPHFQFIQVVNICIRIYIWSMCCAFAFEKYLRVCICTEQKTYLYPRSSRTKAFATRATSLDGAQWWYNWATAITTCRGARSEVRGGRSEVRGCSQRSESAIRGQRCGQRSGGAVRGQIVRSEVRGVVRGQRVRSEVRGCDQRSGVMIRGGKTADGVLSIN